LLNEEGVEYTYREYVEDPLSLAELTSLLGRLDRSPSEALRKRDAKTVGLSGEETDAQLIKLMARHPTLLERPILDDGKRAVTGRPIENLLAMT